MITLASVDGYSIHAVPPPVAGIALSRFDGLGSPAPRGNRPERGREHGLVELTTYYGGRVFGLEGYVRAATWADFWPYVDELKRRFALVGSTHLLRWRREGLAYTERAVVTVDSELELPDRIVTPFLRWGVTLVAADPRMYGDTLRTLGPFASTGTATNDGNFNSPPTITFNGAGTNPGLRNNSLSTENEIRLAHVLGGGDVAVVDVAERTCTLNGTRRDDIVNASATHFWKLVAGANNLEKLGGAVSIEVAWRDARI